MASRIDPIEGDVRPFSNSSEADCWTAHNCELCYRTKGDNPNAMPRCPIYAAILTGHITGTIPLELAKRAGCTGNRLPPRCAEFATVDPRGRERDAERLAAWNAGQPIRSEA